MKSNDKELKTEVETGEFKGNPVLTIHEIDKHGERVKYPVLAFGKKKAQAILKHIKEIEEFAKS